MKRNLLVQQTLEATQVAGFNQLYDDFTGTKALCRVGADLFVADGLYMGTELLWGDVDFAEFSSDDSSFQETRERRYETYLYWIPAPRWAFSVKAVLDEFELAGTATGSEPEEVRTLMVPVGLRYFHPNGLFATSEIVGLEQRVERGPEATLDSGTDDTFLLNVSLGYRLPDRHGIASIDLRNLLGSDFRYQDESFRGGEGFGSRLLPEQSILARLTLSF